ncbi:MAG: prepilin-type N-terminal cleavage/methylation domain-containing protein, partial [Planctomycetales bacterium]|nr:prepilin-type N-terminal cleavage/methylation domain-containing protein [Planctomycetales bacterium]
MRLLLESPFKATRSQSGFTLVEALVALAIGALVVGSAALGLSVTRRSNQSSSTDIASSNSAFQTGSRFADDVSSAGPVAGVTSPIGAGESGCGSVTSALRLIGPKADGTGVQVRSYHETIDGGRPALQRRTCSGTDIAAALAATPSDTSNVVRDLSSGTDAVTVTCDGGPVTTACRVVEMDVETYSGRTFTVRGTVRSALTPTPTTAPTPVIAPPTGTCTIMASETAWGSTGGVAGGTGGHAGDGTM